VSGKTSFTTPICSIKSSFAIFSFQVLRVA
jgi:hypothetical protein